MIVKSLLTEYSYNPIGIQTQRPRLSWKMVSRIQGQKQTAYQILVANDFNKINENVGNIWDSGKIESDQSINIAYDGAKLQSGERYWWKVRVWDKDNNIVESNRPSFWEMGLLKQTDWKAKWISSNNDIDPNVNPDPSPYFRKEFQITEKVKQARVYICGLGYYELYLNGDKVGDRVLEPAFTRYDKRVLYSVYDITNQLKKGINVAGIILGNGWYNMHTRATWYFSKAVWRNRPTVICQFAIDYEGGRKELMITDKTWKVTTGPILFESIRNGEYYDARLELGRWNHAGYNDYNWLNVEEVLGPSGKLVAQTISPIRVTDTLNPVGISEPKPGIFVFDIGQNIAGWVRLKVMGPRGTEVILKYGERLKNDGTVTQEKLDQHVKSGLFQTDKYILKGQGQEIWEPRFVYHGFRYVQVEGFPGVLELQNIHGRVVHTDFKQAGSFQCSNKLLNNIQKCVLWSYRSNFHGYPTDCPHREKNGWTGDAHLACEQAMYNWDNILGYEKWINDIEDEQQSSGEIAAIIPTAGWGYEWGNGPAWDSAFILIAWYCYLYRGDARILANHYEGFKKYIKHLSNKAENYILKIGLGDWAPAKTETPVEITSTSYYYINAITISKIANILDKTEDVVKYTKLANDIRQAYNKKYYKGNGIYSSGSQTALSCPLYNGIVEESEKQKVVKKLSANIKQHDCHLDTGILGAKYLFHSLSENGKHDVAYRVATETTFPSYGYWLKHNATTLWEFWHDETESLNHIMYGDISCWFYQKLAGINPDPVKPGFKNIVFNPMITGDITWAKTKHESMYGEISSYWKIEDKKLTIKVKVPVNCTATIHIPSRNRNAVKIFNSKTVQFIDFSNSNAILYLDSGNYVFESELSHKKKV